MISESLLTSTESHIKKHASFLDMLLRGENLKIELTKKATQGELKAILELCLNMKEGNLSMPKKESTPNYRHNTRQQKYFIDE